MSLTPQVEQWMWTDPVLGLPSIRKAHEVDQYLNETYLAYLGYTGGAQSLKGNHFGKVMLVKTTLTDLAVGEFVVVDRSTYQAVRTNGVLTGDIGVVLAVQEASSTATEFFIPILVEGQVAAKVDAAVTAGAQLYSDAAVPGAGYAAAGLIMPGVKAITAAAAAAVTTGATGLTRDYAIGEAQVYLNARDV